MHWQSVYDSPWHVPGTSVLALGIVLALVARVGSAFFRSFGWVWALAITFDAVLTGPLTPVAESSPWATFFGVFFVIAGDLRFFQIILWALEPEARRVRTLLRAGALALAVPIVVQLLRAALPFPNLRTTFLVYEVLFSAIALATLVVVVPRVPEEQGRRAFARRIAAFELVMYAAWAASDVLILCGAEVGFLARIVPNVLYYAAFVPFVVATRPRAIAP